MVTRGSPKPLFWVRVLVPLLEEPVSKETGSFHIVTIYRGTKCVNASIKRIEDYTFSPFKSQIDCGDSGPLLIATARNQAKERYVVKHCYADCAANEFVYTQLGQAIELKMPNVVLFCSPSNKELPQFRTKYVMGSEFIPIAIEHPTFEQIRDTAPNWEDYFRFQAMFAMLDEADSFETPLASDSYVYRIDTSASFTLDKAIMSAASFPQFQNVIRDYICGMDYDKPWEKRSYLFHLRYCIDNYGIGSKRIFLDTFERMVSLRPDFVDSFLHTLNKLYPEIICDYYKRYISGVQRQAKLFLTHGR